MIDKVTVPEGKSGNWHIERFEVDQHGAFMESLTGRPIRPGVYTRLMHGRTVVMSDTPAEMRDHYAAVRAASGVVLINGLGLGMVANACLAKPSVDRVIVIELSPDVISLVAPHYAEIYGARFEVVNASAFDYKPTEPAYGAVWHDIWNDLCADNLPEMTRLKRKYARRANWQGCWGEHEIRAYARRQRRAWY